MVNYIARRVISLLPVFLLVAFIGYSLLYLSPADPAIAILGAEATPEMIEALRVELGLDKPFIVQFARWLLNALRGDLGQAFSMGMSVTEAIAQRLSATASLAVFGYAIAVVLGIPAGIIAAVKRNSAVDRLVMSSAVLGISLPTFVTGILLILAFSLRLRWFPSGGYVPWTEDFWRGLRCLALPGLAVGVFQAALLSRMTRSSMLEVLRQDYIRTARGKGVRESAVVLRHGLRNALVPILTIVGMGLGSLLGGVVVIESVFAYPGLGRLAVFAIQRRDYPLFQGIILFLTSVYVIVNLVVDIVYAAVDPRIKYN